MVGLVRYTILSVGISPKAADSLSERLFLPEQSKNLMAKYHIPTAKYQTFTELAPALAYIEAEGAPIVVKADGLALGKGVIVAQTVAEAQEAARSMMDGRKFGQAGARVPAHSCCPAGRLPS